MIKLIPSQKSKVRQEGKYHNNNNRDNQDDDGSSGIWNMIIMYMSIHSDYKNECRPKLPYINFAKG